MPSTEYSYKFNIHTTNDPTPLGKSLGKVEKIAVISTAVPTPSNILKDTQIVMKAHLDTIRFTNLNAKMDMSSREGLTYANET